MYSYRVAIVDDMPETCARISDGLNALTHVEVRTAKDAPSAIELLDNEFFHLVLLDLQLDETSDALDGKEVYEYIARYRPSTKIIMMTNYASMDATVELLYDLFRPDQTFDATRVFAGLIDKGDAEPRDVAVSFVAAQRAAWLNSVVGIEESDLAEILKAVEPQRITPGWYAPRSVAHTAKMQEIDHVVSTLLGQTCDADAPIRNRSVEFAPKSASQLSGPMFVARTTSPTSPPMGWILLKLGGIDEVGLEAQRYEHFARFDIEPDHRVELLSTAFGNALGAISYGLAPAQPDQMRSLRAWIRDEPNSAIPLIDRVFSPDAKRWYSHVGANVPSLHWFHQYYGDRFGQRAEAVRGELTQIAGLPTRNGPSTPSMHVMSDGLHFGDDEGIVALPSKGDQGLVDTDLATCVVHGALNSDNVLTIVRDPLPPQPIGAGPPSSSVEEVAVKIINFGRTGLGPRCLDFGLLAGDMRVAVIADSTSLLDVARLVTAERKLADLIWSLEADELVTRCFNDSAWQDHEPWERLAALLVANLRLNFPDVTEREYAVTCCLVGLGTRADLPMSTEQSRAAARLRIAVWLDPHIRYLREESVRIGG